jgi:hypothetical protein
MASGPNPSRVRVRVRQLQGFTQREQRKQRKSEAPCLRRSPRVGHSPSEPLTIAENPKSWGRRDLGALSGAREGGIFRDPEQPWKDTQDR